MIKKSYYINWLLATLIAAPLIATPAFSQDIPGSEYIVKQGDTLWGISSSHYTDPFLWPKLWGKNSSIPHPDKIYPGQKIFLPSEAALKELEKQEEAAAPPAPLAEKEISIPKEETEPVELSEEDKGVTQEEANPQLNLNSVEAEEPEAQDHYPAWTLSDLVSSGYILKNSSEENRAGMIVASENEHLLLGEGDVVYLVSAGHQDFKVGERYTIYELSKAMHHPVNHRMLGRLVRIKGVLEIIPNTMASEKDTYSARIVTSYELIALKDSVMAYQPTDPIRVMINAAPVSRELKGYVIASRDTKEANGEHDIVYLDKGSLDGIQPGSKLVVFREGKKAKFYSPTGVKSLPRRVIADLDVISVQKESSTAIISRSLEPVNVGDPISNPPAIH